MWEPHRPCSTHSLNPPCSPVHFQATSPATRASLSVSPSAQHTVSPLYSSHAPPVPEPDCLMRHSSAPSAPLLSHAEQHAWTDDSDVRRPSHTTAIGGCMQGRPRVPSGGHEAEMNGPLYDAEVGRGSCCHQHYIIRMFSSTRHYWDHHVCSARSWMRYISHE